jgi:hypothetical protein
MLKFIVHESKLEVLVLISVKYDYIDFLVPRGVHVLFFSSGSSISISFVKYLTVRAHFSAKLEEVQKTCTCVVTELCFTNSQL